MKKLLLISGIFLFGNVAYSQLCQPTFVNGCGSWNSQYINVGTIDWWFDQVDCTVSDYTADYATTITANVATPVLVTSGAWCGCSVWIDFNKDNNFDNSENLYHVGNGGTETMDFSFNITVPASTMNGNYTMRVISSWGSDGFTVGDNGYGGCGTYQYGNFQDFAITVIGGQNPLGLSESKMNPVNELAPNPVENVIQLKGEIQKTYSIVNEAGITILQTENQGNSSIDVSTLAPGVYFLKSENQVQRFIKL